VTVARRLNNALVELMYLERRVDPYFRPAFDRLLRPPITAVAQAGINARRRDPPLGLAEERLLPDEEQIIRSIVDTMSQFTRQTYTDSPPAERAGNTKTYGVVKGSFEVLEGVPDRFRQGLFAVPRTYPAWFRLAGPGPLAPADMKDNGVLSIGIKVCGVEGPKLMEDEVATQDFTGISAPTFTTPNIVENLRLQGHVLRGTPIFYFLGPRHPHLADAIMQGLYAKTQLNPLQERYWSCASCLLGAGQAMHYSVIPRSGLKTPWPRRPSADYLRQAMATTLAERAVEFDFAVQVQTDPRRMPVEHDGVEWPERLSPFVAVARLTIPAQTFDTPAQLSFASNLSYNPWHCLAEHRPLGNQNRARKAIYFELSRLRQAMNHTPHIEPTGMEVFDSVPPLNRGAP
jgi:hypothetical protein